MKLIKFSILFFSVITFTLFIFISSPYRQLRPYNFFMGKLSAKNYESISINGRQAILIPGITKSDSFYIDQIPVTISAYKECIDSGICISHHYRNEYEKYWNSSLYEFFPVSFVTLEEARIFCKSAGGDIPTAIEWELAAGTSEGYDYAWGNDMPSISKANLDGYYQWLTPAGWLPKGASPHGVLDLNGNVREWILDADPADPEGNGLKGGSFQDPISSCKNGYTIYHLPTSAGFNRGFRCVYHQDN